MNHPTDNKAKLEGFHPQQPAASPFAAAAGNC